MEISCDELHESRLTSSTSSDKCCLLSSLDREGEVIEDLRFIVSIGDIIYFDIFGFFKESRTRVVSFDFWGLIKNIP
jgi:hypothetical protein